MAKLIETTPIMAATIKQTRTGTGNNQPASDRTRDSEAAAMSATLWRSAIVPCAA